MKAVLRGENNFSSQKPKAMLALICMSLPEFTISPKAKSWSLMNRTWVGLLGDWPPLWLRDVLPRQWSHCCNHPRSHTVDLQGERLLPAHLALANASPILKAIHRGHPACLPENITIADTCPCCGSCFPTAEAMIFNELQRCFLLTSDFMPFCPSDLLTSYFVT